MRIQIAKVELTFGTLSVEKNPHPATANHAFVACARWPGSIAYGYGATRTDAVEDVRRRHNLFLEQGSGNGKEEFTINGIAS